jgi:hypothetical protein
MTYEVTRIGTCHVRDAVGPSSETAFRSLRTANQLRSVRRNASDDHDRSVVSSFERGGSHLRLHMRVPVSFSGHAIRQTSERREPLRAPQGNYPVRLYDVRRLILSFAVRFRRLFLIELHSTPTSFRIVLSDGSSINT